MDTKILEINAYTASILPGAQGLSESSQKFLDAYKAIGTDYGLCCGVYTSLGTVDDDYGSYAIGQVRCDRSIYFPNFESDGFYFYEFNKLRQ